MAKISTFKEYSLNELRDTYDSEKQILAALPKMSEAATAPELKQAFELHTEQTRTQIQRLEQIFHQMNESPSGNTCEATIGLIKEAKEVMSELEPGALLDAGLIAASQRVEHYEIASYGSAHAYALLAGDHEAAQLLETTLKEEEGTDNKLTQIAESVVNPKAFNK